MITEAKLHVVAPLQSGHWRHVDLDLIRDGNDRPIWNMANVLQMLKSHSEWKSVLAFNEFEQKRVLMRPVPGQLGSAYPRPIQDEDYASALAWFNFNGFPRAKNDVVYAAMRKVCKENPFDPLRDYLDGLQWDGAERLRTWLSNYCGAERSEYTSEVGVRWVISAVARGLRPGCKVDHMLVLEGAQGRRKSTALATLAGAEWFSDSLPQMGSKDASAYLAGKWVVEVGELEAMRRDVDGIKAFLSRSVERYRPAYGREEVVEPRRCVFAGTTNKSDWQRDETGGRRFWPVKVGEIDIDALAKDRDQLWAEAVALFRNGERWWLTGEAATAAQAEVELRRAEDPWRSRIELATQGNAEITAKEVLARLEIQERDMTPAMCRRVAAELTAMGWVKEGRMTSGKHKGQARFKPGEDVVRQSEER